MRFTDRADAGRWRCGVVPMRLTLRDIDKTVAEPITFLELHGDGSLMVPMLMTRPIGRLGVDGCLLVDGLVVLELTPSGKLWTGQHIFQVEGNRLHDGGVLQDGGVTITIRDDGVVTVSRHPLDATEQPWARFEGYRPEGLTPRSGCRAYGSACACTWHGPGELRG